MTPAEWNERMRVQAFMLLLMTEQQRLEVFAQRDRDAMNGRDVTFIRSIGEPLLEVVVTDCQGR